MFTAALCLGTVSLPHAGSGVQAEHSGPAQLGRQSSESQAVEAARICG